MTEPAVALAGVRLHHYFIRLCERNVFGSAEPLQELAIYAREVTLVASLPEHRALAFVLETVLRRWADDVGERELLLSERNALDKAFRSPVAAAAECLAGKDADALVIIDALIKAASEVLPRLVP